MTTSRWVTYVGGVLDRGWWNIVQNVEGLLIHNLSCCRYLLGPGLRNCRADSKECGRRWHDATTGEVKLGLETSNQCEKRGNAAVFKLEPGRIKFIVDTLPSYIF